MGNIVNLYINLVRIILIILSAYHIKKRNLKAILSAAAVVGLTFLPYALERVMDIQLDFLGRVLYIAIIVMSVYLGSSLKYYDKYYWWDIVIHFLSGIVFVSFGIALSKKAANLSSFSILLFSFTLSVTLHVIWEVLEYIVDCMFHTDNQRWQKVSASNNHVSESAIQPAGLVDTMNDTLICIAGTAVSCVIWWFVLT